MTGRPAAFLDRDGVLCELVPDPRSGRLESPLAVDQVRLIPGAAAAARRLADAGWALVCVTNQPAAAKGFVSVARVHDIQQRVVDLLADAGVILDGVQMCLHHPNAVTSELGGCDCRKPAPGMLLVAAAELELDLERSWMIGDTDGDVGAGRAAGCQTILVLNPGSSHKRSASAEPDAEAADLAAAAEVVLERAGSTPFARSR